MTEHNKRQERERHKLFPLVTMPCMYDGLDTQQTEQEDFT
jgi:alpha-glucosidase (family GH31 glycosyl hydrolase)